MADAPELRASKAATFVVALALQMRTPQFAKVQKPTKTKQKATIDPMLRQNFATNSTVMTKYGGAITFGWEFESLTLDILKWYQPNTLQDWPKDLAAQKKWVKKQQETGNWGQAKALSWDLFSRKDEAPYFLDDQLRQEIFDTTWEMTPKRENVAGNVDALFEQLEVVRGQFHEVDGFQVHIVFEAPGHNEQAAQWHGRIAALYRLLNDYAALKFYRQNAKHMTSDRFTGAPTEGVRKLIARLNDVDKKRPIDRKDQDGAWVSQFKFHKIGFRREVYGETGNLLGLEVRGGWKPNLKKLREFIEAIVRCLQTLDDDLCFKQIRRAKSASLFTLDQHLEFCMKIPSLDDFDPDLSVAMNELALRICNNRFNRTKDGNQPNLPYVDYRNEEEERDDEDDAKTFAREVNVIRKRWMMAFMPWESHVALSADKAIKDTIIAARLSLAKNIVQLYNDNNESKDKSARRRRAQTKKYRDPNKTMGQFFNEYYVTTGIHRYL